MDDTEEEMDDTEEELDETEMIQRQNIDEQNQSVHHVSGVRSAGRLSRLTAECQAVQTRCRFVICGGGKNVK